MVSAQPEAFEGQWPQRPIKGMARKSTQQHYDRKHTHTHIANRSPSSCDSKAEAIVHTVGA